MPKTSLCHPDPVAGRPFSDRTAAPEQTDADYHPQRGQDQATGDELRKTEALLLGTLEQTPVGILILDAADGRVLKSNPESARILGFPRDELAGRKFFEGYGNTETGWTCFYPDKRPYPLSELPSYRALFESHVSRNVELILRRQDHSDLWVMTNTAPIVAPRGSIIAVVIILHDINDIKTAEERLRENEERLNYALTASDEALWDWDFRTDDGYLSPRYYEMLGYPDQAFPGTGKIWKSMIHPEDRAEALLRVREIKENKADAYRSIYRLRTQTGEYRWILSRAMVVTRDADNQPVRVVGTHLDITELRRMEDALREANRKLEIKVRKRTEELQKSRSVSNRFKEELTELQLLETKHNGFVAESREMQQVLQTAVKLAHLNVSNILITGESGTGKGLLAKFIHQVSKRNKQPFVQINCAALPENLLEAELFGYEKGAFTGASDKGKVGLFELAGEGTLFLDEIGELPVTVQAKLLKCLDEKEIMHLGGLAPISIKCTVIAATNAALPELVGKKQFRQDLFFRLNTFPVTIPPLRERPEDIFELTAFFIQKYNDMYSFKRKLSSRGYRRLQKYPFPGNVRELENLVKKAVALSEDDLIDDLIEKEIGTPEGTSHSLRVCFEHGGEGFEARVAAFEKEILVTAIKQHATTRALSSHLKMSQSAVVRRLKKHGLSKQLGRTKGRP